MQPEFLRAISSESDSLNPWVTVIGEHDPKNGDILYNIYKDVCGKVYRTNLENAEFMKFTIVVVLMLSRYNLLMRCGY
ncbi:MAG: hypothetical protein ABJB76_02250 [Candidatus Nitrosocosmicus sp.]